MKATSVKAGTTAIEGDKQVANHGRRERAKLTEETIRTIWSRLRGGEYQHDIAADLGINQGRISEVKTGKRGGNTSGAAPA